MTQPKAEADIAAPLLIELARAVRAHQFFAEGHATRSHALQKATSVWQNGLEQLGELDLEVSPSGFRLNGTVPLDGPPLDDLATALHGHGIMGVQVHPSLDADELRSFVEALAHDPIQLEQRGRLVGVLREAGVRHVALWEIPQTSSHASGAGQGPPAAAEHAEGSAPGSASPGASSPEHVSGLTVDLLKELANLEQCDDLGDYRIAANRIDSCLSRLTAAKNYVDMYRAALVYCRHVGDSEGRTQPICSEAQDRLRTMLRDSEMLRFVMDKGFAPEGISTVQAVQVLSCAAPQAVPRLLEEHARSDELRGRSTAILIAMGDEAFPAIVEELSSETSARMRRAARLLGDLQHPSGVKHLAGHLEHPETEMRREVAGALARIGTTHAIQVLAAALSRDPELAIIAAGGLGGCRHRDAVRALAGSGGARRCAASSGAGERL